jgi:hypothetical protein
MKHVSYGHLTGISRFQGRLAAPRPIGKVRNPINRLEIKQTHHAFSYGGFAQNFMACQPAFGRNGHVFDLAHRHVLLAESFFSLFGFGAPDLTVWIETCPRGQVVGQ